MSLAEYTRLDALELAELVRSRQASAQELAALALDACRRVNPALNAVVETWDGEFAGAGEGPFAGVPFLIKDAILQMAGKRSEAGCRLAADLVAPADSTLMARIRAAGLITLGRTATPELACSLSTETILNGATRNPWDTALGVAGSSGGAAAAVAAGVVPMAHANDGGGSIRSPASWCGLFGLKPSRGRVPAGPGVDEALLGMIQELAISRTVRDSAALLDAVHGPSIGDPFVIRRPERPYLEEVGRDPGSLRIGVMAQPFGGVRTEAGIVAAVERVASQCEALGHRVEIADASLGMSWEAFMASNARLWLSSLAAGIDGLAAAVGRPIDETTLEPATLAYHRFGRTLRGDEVHQALGARNVVTRSLGAWFATHDILLSPTMPTMPLPIGDLFTSGGEIDAVEHLAWLFGYTPFTPISNVAGLPAMTMPLAHDEERDLPIGLHFVAGFGGEDLLFRLAGQLERALPWTDRVPKVHAASAR